MFFLFLGLRNFYLFEKKIDLAKEEVDQNSHLQIRLNHLFSQLIPSSFIDQNSSPFYTALFPKETQKSLICVFDNGLDPDPKFSGPVMGRIFLTKNQELHLILWPLEKDGSLPTIWREELLLADVDKASFEFFTEEKKDSQSSWIWAQEWLEEKNELPLMIRLSLQKKGKKTLFAFFPPNSSPPTYKREAL